MVGKLLRTVQGLRGSIRVRLLALVILVVLPAGALVAFSGIRERQNDEANVRNNASQLVQVVAGQYLKTREGAEQLITGVAQLDQLKDSGQCNDMLRQMAHGFSQYHNIHIADPQGQVICSSAYPDVPPTTIGDRPYFLDALATRSFAEGPYQIGRVTGRPSIGYAFPIIDDDGTILGAVATSLDLAWMNQLLSSVKVPAGATVLFLDRFGTVLAQYPDSGWVGQSMRNSKLFQDLPKNSQQTFTADGPDGKGRLFGSTRLSAEAGGGSFVVGLPASMAYATANFDMKRNLILLGAVSIFALITAWYFGDMLFFHDIRRLVLTSRRLAAGDLTARSGIAPKEDEVGVLVHAFDEMADSLSERQRLQDEHVRLSRELQSKKEREQLAQQLHDDVAQFFFGISLVCNDATVLEDDSEGLRQRLRKVRELAATGAGQTRQAIKYLSGDAPALSVVDALNSLTQPKPFGGPQVVVKLDATVDDLSEARKELIYSAAREAIYNAVKHSDATRVEIKLAEKRKNLVLSVTDNGQGNASAIRDAVRLKRGYGLRTLRDKTVQAGGSMMIRDNNAGVSLTIRLPLETT